MRLLVLTSSFPLHPGEGRAAAGLFVADFARELARRGHQVTVATPDKPGSKGAWPDFQVVWLPWPGGDKPLSQIRLHDPREWLGIASLALGIPRQLRHLAKRADIEGVVAMWAIPCGRWANGLRKRLRLPYVNWCLGSDVWHFGRNPMLRPLLRQALRGSVRNYADGLALAEEAEAISGRPCEFLPSSRTHSFDAAPAGMDDGPRPLFFFVGRYVEVKGVDVLLDAFERYLASGGRGRLVLRGGGPLEAEVRRRAATGALRDRVDVGGFIDQGELSAWLQVCDVVVVPSRLESIPLVYSDALQAGRPLVVTDVGDMGRLMRRQGAGRVVPPEDAEALAGALLSLDEQGVEPYRAAVEKAAAEFDLGRAAERVAGDLRRGPTSTH